MQTCTAWILQHFLERVGGSHVALSGQLITTGLAHAQPPMHGGPFMGTQNAEVVVFFNNSCLWML